MKEDKYKKCKNSMFNAWYRKKIGIKKWKNVCLTLEIW